MAPIGQERRVMYDSVSWRAIPLGADIVAGYVDGLYRWPDEAWQRFASSVRVRIAVLPWTNDGEVLDCETGDATPAQCPGWVRMREAANPGQRFTIYVNRSMWPAVQREIDAAGLTVDYWIAEYGPPTYPHIPYGAAACQWADPAAGSGGNYDISLCEPWWPRET